MPTVIETESAKYVHVINDLLGVVLETADGVALAADTQTGALITIANSQREVHVGETFRFFYVVPHGSELANDASLDIVMEVGATRANHIVFEMAGGGDSEFLIYKVPAYTGGTPLYIHNLNETNPKDSVSRVLLSPTVTSAGTLIDQIFLPGGTAGQSLGGSIRSSTEDIWQVNRAYLMRITNRSGSAQQFSLKGQWYEEP